MTRPRHILYLVHAFGVGGLEQVVIELANRLDRNRFRVSICAMSRCDPAAMARVCRSDVLFHQLHRRRGNDWRLVPTLRKLIVAHRVDLVQSHNWGTFAEAALAGAWAAVPVVHAVHNLGLQREKRLLRRWIRAYTQQVLAPLVGRFVLVGRQVQQSFCRYVHPGPDRMVLIRNGVALSPPLSRRQRKLLRQQLGLSEEDFVFVFVGRLHPYKNLPLLLHAVERLASSGSRFRLLVVGDGKQRDYLRQLCRRLGIGGLVRMLGRRDDVRRILACCDALVLPSLTEGLPVSVLEAMAEALPVVATDVGGVAELVEHDRTGLLVESGDLEGLTAAMSRLLESRGLARGMGAAGRERVERFFNVERMVGTYQNLYAELLSVRD